LEIVGQASHPLNLLLGEHLEMSPLVLFFKYPGRGNKRWGNLLYAAREGMSPYC